MNPFFSSREGRPRSWIRIPFFLFFAMLILSLNSFRWMGFQYVLTGLMIFGFFWLTFRFTDNRPDISESGLAFTPLWRKEFGIGCLVGFLGALLVFLTEWASGDLTVTGFAWNRLSSTFWMIPAFGYLVQMLSVGFYEELISRSYLIPNLKEGFTIGSISPQKATIPAILISSALFGVGHIGNPGVTWFALINILFGGIMLALPYVLTGRLSYSVGLHFSWNFAQGGIFGFRVSGTEPIRPLIGIHQEGHLIWTGGSFGPEGGVIGLLAIVLMTVLVVRYIYKQQGILKLSEKFRHTFLENSESSAKPDELR